MLKTLEFKVGLFVVLTVSCLVYLSFKVDTLPSFGGHIQVWFLTSNARGLVPNSLVRVAGVSVGTIRSIDLKEGKVKVVVKVKKSIRLRKSTEVYIRSSGILGDKYIDLTLGNLQDELLKDGDVIHIVHEATDFNKALSSASHLMHNLNRSVFGGGDDNTVIGRILLNLERTTGAFAYLLDENKENLEDTLVYLHESVKTLHYIVNDPERGLKNLWPQLSANTDRSLQSVEEITRKINAGEGTVGQLVNDNSTVERLNEALDGVNELIGSAKRWEMGFLVDSYYLNQKSLWRSGVGMRIRTSIDRHYDLMVVSDRLGVTKTTAVETTTGGGEDGRDEILEERTEKKSYHSETKFTGLFGQRFYDFTLKGGIIENSAGIQLDYDILPRHLTFSVQGTNFTKLNLRTFLRYQSTYGIYFQAGYYDLLENEKLDSALFGAGIYLTNDDLKTLMTRIPLN